MIASQASSSFYYQGVFPAASHKIDLTWSTSLTHILPPVLCQYLIGVLVQLDGTRFYRLALLPVVFWLARRAMSVDISGGDPAEAQVNSALITHMCAMSLRCTVWALARVRYQRHSPTINQKKSDSESVYTACWNACDLLLNLRGIGWNWPQGFVPKPPKTNSRVVFVLWSAVRIAFYAVAFDACVQSIRALSPETFGSINGGTLFDHSLPPALEYLRAVFVSFMVVTGTYCMLQCNYNSLATVCVILFQQHPSQWPPLFDSPFLSTSLGELWGRRWHQMLRDILLTLGAQPLNCLFGRLGGVFGAFLFSGIFHDMELQSAGRGGNLLPIVGFWAMHGVGIILERVWRRVTGRPVGGVWGWVWMAAWLLFWGVPMIDEYAKAGRFGAMNLPGRIAPSLVLLRMLVR